MGLAIPMTLAQLVNVLYSVVDRIYIGHIPNASTHALTGIGLALPIITIITAFTNLFGTGGAPLCSIARGSGQHERAERIMGNSFSLLLIFGVGLMALCLAFKRPILYLFGASGETFPYANAYLSIYLCGTVFVMISLGMNNFINAQGFGRIGMFTVMIGAVLNLILDPVFIFLFGMGVRGAALATVLSQFASAAFVLRFLTGKQAVYRLSRKAMPLNGKLVREITTLGMSGFIMAVTNSLVQIVCNSTLAQYGGDLYVGIMTVINSVREIMNMPVNGLSSGAQPVIGYNYGAREYKRVKSSILFSTGAGIAITVVCWALLFFFPEFFLRFFTGERELIVDGIPAMKIYFFGIFMMALQFSGQCAFVALGKSRHAIFFSLFRKVIIVVPLTLILPKFFGVNGVFMAEPISNFLGGTACFVTMLLTVWPALKTEVKKS